MYSRLNRPIVIVPYNPLWPGLYEDEKDRIRYALGEEKAAIEHFGSTSIVGLAAKPVIDIAIGIPQLDQAGEYLIALEKLGYRYMPELEAALPERRFLWRVTTAGQRYHISLTEMLGPLWERPIRFRDYLRQHPRDAKKYERLKQRLALQFGSDIGAYIQAKTGFVEQLLQKAQAEAKR